jgi:hypothetical protein
MKHLLLGAILVVCTFTLPPATAGSLDKDVAQSGDTVLNATLAKTSIVVRFRALKLKKADPGFPLALEQYDEVSVIRQMSISVAGQDVWVPRSVYADLFNARRASVTSENGIFVLLIGGADGADSYSVHIRFSAARVISRAVYDAMSPQRLSEKTVYSKTEVIG